MRECKWQNQLFCRIWRCRRTDHPLHGWRWLPQRGRHGLWRLYVQLDITDCPSKAKKQTTTTTYCLSLYGVRGRFAFQHHLNAPPPSLSMSKLELCQAVRGYRKDDNIINVSSTSCFLTVILPMWCWAQRFSEPSPQPGLLTAGCSISRGC